MLFLVIFLSYASCVFINLWMRNWKLLYYISVVNLLFFVFIKSILYQISWNLHGHAPTADIIYVLLEYYECLIENIYISQIKKKWSVSTVILT